MKQFFKIFSLILACIACIFLIMIDFVSFVIVAFFIALSTALFTGALRVIVRRMKNFSFKKNWLWINISMWAILGILTVFWGIGVWQQNYNDPAQLANVTLENSAGQKVVFVKMSHIATPKFYEEKHKSIEKLANDNYTILAEGVREGSSETAVADFADVSGLDFSIDLYGVVGKFLWLKAQDETLYDNIDEQKIKNVDITMDEVMALVKENFWENPPKNIISMPNAESLETANQEFDKLSSFSKTVFQQTGLMLLNFSLKYSQNMLYSSDENLQKLFQIIILQKRNEPVVKYISENPNENIAVVYGALHFDGILSDLRKNDNSWKIVSAESFFPYSQR